MVSVSEKHPTYRGPQGDIKHGRRAWMLRIKSRTPEKLFHQKRKRAIATRLKHQAVAKKIVRIENTSRRETIRCLHVSHPTGLYVTDNYTVTHNSDCGFS